MTVAIVDTQTDTKICIHDDDFRIEWFSGTGNGGQHRNRHKNSCRLIHKSGIVKTHQGRSRDSNLKYAKEALLSELQKLNDSESAGEVSSFRAGQIGKGIRSDKVRTYRFKDDEIIDHRSNKSCKAKKAMKGNMDIFWE